MGLMVINGATAGGFSPISIFGSIVNGVVERNDLAGNPTLLFLSSLIFNTLLSVVVFFLFGGRDLMNRRVDTEPDATDRFKRETTPSGQPVIGGGAVAMTDEAPALDRDKIITLLGIATLVALAVMPGIDWDVGFVAVSIAVVLSLAMPNASKDAANKVAWSTVLLICGIVMYVSLMEETGTIDWLGEKVADVGAPLLAALLICFIGGAVSRVRVHHRHPRRADPARRAVPAAGRDRRRRRDHRALHRVLGRRLEPVLDLRRADRREHARGAGATTSTSACSSGA